MHIPTASTEGCDVALWRDGRDYYWMSSALTEPQRLTGSLSKFITDFPETLTLCIMNDRTGKFVKILPVAN